MHGAVSGRSKLILILATATLAALVLTGVALAAADTSKTNATTPPPNWEDKWGGMYAGQDHLGKVHPPGMPVTNITWNGETPEPPPNSLDVAVASVLRPWALARQAAMNVDLDNTGEQCKPTGLFLAGAQGGFELLTSPGRITMILMGGGGIDTGGIRRIYLNRPHLKNPPLTWNGDSIGHWEGDTLVIDTTGLNDKSWIGASMAPHSEDIHVTERWQFVSDGTWLEDSWRIEDPEALKAPVVFTRYHKKLPSDTPVRENLCEDNPAARRGWKTLYKRALKDQEEEQTKAEAASAQQDSQR